MGSKFRISVKFKLNYFILHFRKMKYNEIWWVRFVLFITIINKNIQKSRVYQRKRRNEFWKKKTIMSCSVLVFRKSSLIAMEYILTPAIKSTYKIIFHGYFLSIFKDILVQSLLYFCSKAYLVKSTGFSTQRMHPKLQ